MLKRFVVVVLVGVWAACSFGCALKFEGKGSVSMFSGLNRETRQEAETSVLERTIVCGLLREGAGDPGLAIAFLKSKGYNDDGVAQRIAIARALPETSCPGGVR